MKEFELIPTRGQKSFYWKARIILTDDGETILRSYTTDVCKIDKAGRFVRLWGGYSLTTMNHINSFIETYGIPGGGKKWWCSLPCDNTEQWRVEYGNGFFTTTSGVIFDNYGAAEEYADTIIKSGHRRELYAYPVEV